MLGFLKHIFKLQFLLIVIAIIAGIYYPQILQRLQEALQETSIDVHYESGQLQQTLFTREQLATYNGENETPLYLALLGSVYDVTKGVKHYGPGCAYNFFVGRDASVSFVTGEFENYVEAEADDVLTLKPNELLSLANWKNFYDNDYTYKGKLVGRFYDAAGAATQYQHKYLTIVEHARESKAAAEKLRSVYPDCNIEWSAETGTRVWCTTTSGGQERAWAGYPRKLFEVGSENFRCACMQKEQLDTTDVMIKPYDDCEHLAHECYYKVD